MFKEELDWPWRFDSKERERGELGLVEGRVSVRKRDEFKIG